MTLSKARNLDKFNTRRRCKDQGLIWSELVSIFNDSQYVAKLDECLLKFVELYTVSDYKIFEKLYMKGLRRLLQSKHTDYLKQSCHFICKLLKKVSDENDDRLVRASVEVTNHYMQILDECCRMNAVFLVGKFLSQVDTLDEELCKVLEVTLSKRIRDKKAPIRRQAVLAACKFQNHSLIKDALDFHFRCDPELSVRKALLQTMDTEVFGCDFLIEATQDFHDNIRATAYQRLAKVSPNDLKLDQLHRVLHNGLFERDRTVSYAFKANMMASWLTKLYDGTDLMKLIDSLDAVNHTEDINRLLEQLHTYNLEKNVTLDNGESATKLHEVVISFRERWLNDKRLPPLENLSERLVIVWHSLIKFCKKNEVIIKTTKDPASQQSRRSVDPNESIESIVDSQEVREDDAALYELLMPDLVNLVDYIRQFVTYSHERLENFKVPVENCELIYQNLMNFMSSYEIGDDSELRKVRDVFDIILKENLLTLKFNYFIPPIIKCLKAFVFPNNPNLLISYISEIINNIRSHLEDEQQMGDEMIDTDDEARVFKGHTGELLECLQMYYACLENVNVTEVPAIMKNLLNFLSYEVISDGFMKDYRVRSWMVACNGITAYLDKEYAHMGSTMTLLVASCFDSASLEIKTIGFKSLVDIMIQHDDLDVPYDRLYRFLNTSLREYGKYNPKTISKKEMDFISTVVKGTTKLYYFQRLSSADPLAHLVLWWYHPRTHSMVRQYIGVFLPLFVKQASQMRKPIEQSVDEDPSWIEEILSNLFVTSIEYLHSYILGPGSNIMDDSDMKSLMNFLCNLVPTTFHPKVMEVLDDKIDDISGKDSGSSDLVKYLKRSKKNLIDLKAQPQAASDDLKLEPLLVDQSSIIPN